MMRQFTIFQERTLLDTFGLITLLLLLAGTSIHFETGKIFVYYRELIAVLFGILWLKKFSTRPRLIRRRQKHNNNAMIYVVLFPILLALWSLFDPGIPLYGDDFVAAVSEHIDGTNVTIYVLRNSVLYIPMVMYFSLRGLNEKEFQLIAVALVLIAPLSVSAYLRSEQLGGLSTLGVIAEFGGQGISYNSYTPFLTFPVMCGIYLMLSRHTLQVKAAVLLTMTITGIFILLSTSRQSVIFVIISAVTFFTFSREFNQFAKLIMLLVIATVATSLFIVIIGDFRVDDSILERFTSFRGLLADDTDRGLLVLEGLLLLDLTQWVTGAGLTSIINSGPHNDYVRWTQRVGVFVMLIGFMPFFIIIRKSYKLMSNTKRGNSLYIFLFLGVGFTLYHSLFGYPREDAFQAPYAYLGLALWFGAMREGLLNHSVVRPDICRDSSASYTENRDQRGLLK